MQFRIAIYASLFRPAMASPREPDRSPFSRPLFLFCFWRSVKGRLQRTHEVIGCEGSSWEVRFGAILNYRQVLQLSIVCCWARKISNCVELNRTATQQPRQRGSIELLQSSSSFFDQSARFVSGFLWVEYTKILIFAPFFFFLLWGGKNI